MKEVKERAKISQKNFGSRNARAMEDRKAKADWKERQRLIGSHGRKKGKAD